MTTTITKTSGGLRIVADGYSESYRAYVQGEYVCDVTITERAATWYGITANGGGNLHDLLRTLDGRQQANSRERADLYPELKGCIVRELRVIQ